MQRAKKMTFKLVLNQVRAAGTTFNLTKTIKPFLKEYKQFKSNERPRYDGEIYDTSLTGYFKFDPYWNEVFDGYQYQFRFEAIDNASKIKFKSTKKNDLINFDLPHTYDALDTIHLNTKAGDDDVDLRDGFKEGKINTGSGNDNISAYHSKINVMAGSGDDIISGEFGSVSTGIGKDKVTGQMRVTDFNTKEDALYTSKNHDNYSWNYTDQGRSIIIFQSAFTHRSDEYIVLEGVTNADSVITTDGAIITFDPSLTNPGI